MRIFVKKLLAKFGYKIAKMGSSKKNETTQGFVLKLDHYLDAHGNFEYSKYKQIQEAGNKDKIDNVWVLENNIELLAKYILEKIPSPMKGICHGTRRGKEQEWFMKYIKGSNVIGTEISSTAIDFPNTIQWDFHEMKPEWKDNFDFIYSNSFDHSFDPSKCINTWISCLQPNGVCIIEHTNLHTPKYTDELDPFGFDFIFFPCLILCWSKGKFAVVDILTGDKLPGTAKEISYFIIKKVR